VLFNYNEIKVMPALYSLGLFGNTAASNWHIVTSVMALCNFIYCNFHQGA
jgi:hypothetical protein